MLSLTRVSSAMFTLPHLQDRFGAEDCGIVSPPILNFSYSQQNLIRVKRVLMAGGVGGGRGVTFTANDSYFCFFYGKRLVYFPYD